MCGSLSKIAKGVVFVREYGYLWPNNNLSLMIKTEHIEPLRRYVSPSMRVVEAQLELSFLVSNLEPIDGGDDPDIDW